MREGFAAAFDCERGPGTFGRMKRALEGHLDRARNQMFDRVSSELLESVSELTCDISDMIHSSSQSIEKGLAVYSFLWDGVGDKSNLLDPKMQQKIKRCREELLPCLEEMRRTHEETAKLVVDQNDGDDAML